MATIRTNDNAPDETIKYCLANVDFELSPGGTYETDDRAALADAIAHPWLQVDTPDEDELSVEYISKSVPYKDDILAAPNSQAFNAAKLHEYQAERAREAAQPVAIEAGLDQGKAVEEGGVAVTLAADTASDEETKKPTKAATKEKK